MTSQVITSLLRRPYARVVVPDDTGRYAARILEFPGCFSEGGTPEEAYENLEKAAGNWLESAVSQGMTVPEPFATQGYSGTVSLRLPKSIHRRAAEYAHRDGVSLNQFLVAAIAARIGAEDLLRTMADRFWKEHESVSMQPLIYRRVVIEAEAIAPASPDWPLSIAPALAGQAEYSQTGKVLLGRGK